LKTIDQLTDAYLDAAGARGGLPGWIETHGQTIRKFARWLAETYSVRNAVELSPSMISGWLESLAKHRQVMNGRPLRPISIWTYASTVRRFAIWLNERGHVTASVVEAFPDLKTPETPVRPALPHSEMRKFLRSLPSSSPSEFQLRALAEFLYTSGARITESLGMNVNDLDFERGQVRLLGKGAKERIVPVGKIALHWAGNYVKAIRPLFLRDPREQAMWLNTAGRRMSYGSFRTRWNENIETTPARHSVTAHLFRRSFTTELVHGGGDLWAVKEMLGHADFGTIRRYVQTDLTALKRTHAKYHPRENGMDSDVWLPGVGVGDSEKPG
jgi:site-specific recombinase XerD